MTPGLAGLQVGTNYQMFRGSAPTNAVGQTSDQALVHEESKRVTVGVASTELMAAAAAGSAGRSVALKVLQAAVTGAHIRVGAAATTSHFLLEPGQSMTLPINAVVNGIRGGASDVMMDVFVLKV